MNGSENECFFQLREFVMLQADWQRLQSRRVTVKFHAKYIVEALYGMCDVVHKMEAKLFAQFNGRK